MNLLGTATVQAQVASSDPARPDAPVQPNQAASPYFTITPHGTAGSKGNYSILVGQQCKATINLPPYVYGTTITYQWKVSGTTFQSWTVVSDPNNQSHTAEADGYGDPTASSPIWYWNDPSSTSETISCTVTATPPSGQTDPNGTGGSGTASVSVQVPTLQAYAIGGYMQVNKALPIDTAHNNLWAGPTTSERSDGTLPAGMNWRATVTTPTSPAFGTGSLQMVQLVTPSNSYTTVANPTVTVPDPENKNPNSLDGTYPYGDVSPENPTSSNPTYADNDAPRLQLDGTPLMNTANKGGSYMDYMMYLPPVAANSASTWVLLATFGWSASGSATIPSNKNWSSYTSTSVTGVSDGAGAVTPPGSNPPQNSLPAQAKFTPVTKGNTFPTWTHINLGGTF